MRIRLTRGGVPTDAQTAEAWREGWTKEEADALLDGKHTRHQRFYQSPSDLCFTVWCSLGQFAIIDTHSPSWQAFDKEHRKGTGLVTTCTSEVTSITWTADELKDVLGYEAPKSSHRWNHDPVNDRYSCTCGVHARSHPVGLSVTACQIAWDLYAERALPTVACTPGESTTLPAGSYSPAEVLPEIAEPQWPSDAEIVEAWDDCHHYREPCTPREAPRNVVEMNSDVNGRLYAICMGTKSNSVTITREDYQAARSRELKRKAAEAREAERARVVCEGTLECDY